MIRTLNAGRPPAETATLGGREFMLGHWYRWDADALPAQFLGVIQSRVSIVKFRHVDTAPKRPRVCPVQEWLERAGGQCEAPELR